MIKIIDLLKCNRENSYKNIANELKLSERIVRYEIDKINDMLQVNKLPLIMKESKGMLMFPEEIELNHLLQENYYIYSQEERIDLMKVLILFNHEMFKLNKLSEIFFVSRATIKNDLNLLEEQLNDLHVTIGYKRKFFLDGNETEIIKLMSNELSKYIYLLSGDYSLLNSFEKFIFDILSTSYEQLTIHYVIDWINRLLDELNYVLTDQSYKWYVSNFLVFIWCALKRREYPIEMLENYDSVDNCKYDIVQKYIDEISDEDKKNLIKGKERIITLLLNYANKYNLNIKSNYSSNYIEMLVLKLISLMAQEMKVPFENDSLLYEGLLNHIEPLIDRINRDIYIDDNTISLLSEKNIEVYMIVKKVIKEIDILRELKYEDEIVKISVYFMASIYRVKNYKIKNVLLVCGLGYGTSSMLKENLMNQYKVEVIDTIPVYKIKSYDNWRNVDIIITTTKLNDINGIPFLLINPILKEEDYKKIESLGITRRKILINYNSINSKLDFLSEKDKLRVIDVIKRETGYQNVLNQSKISKLTDILDHKNIRIIERIPSWRKSVILATSILEERYFIDEDYKFDIISGIEKLGFYSIMNNNIALLHGSRIESVIKTSMSLIITKDKVTFGEKNVNIIFCLASRDKKEHVPAIICLMRIIKNTDFINRIKSLEKEEEIYEEIVKCEKVVMD